MIPYLVVQEWTQTELKQIKVQQPKKSSRVTQTRPGACPCPSPLTIPDDCILQRTALPRSSSYLEMVQSSERAALADILAPV